MRTPRREKHCKRFYKMSLEGHPPILLLAAMPFELKPLTVRLGIGLGQPAKCHSLNNRLIVAVAGGMGGQRILAALDTAMDRYYPELVVNLGLAGAVNPALPAAAVMRIRQVCHPVGGSIGLNDLQACGRLMTVDEPANTRRSKAEIHQKHHVDLVDMESFHIARRLENTSTELRIIRAVSDTADTAFPAGLLAMVNEQGVVPITTALRYFITRPAHIRCAIRLRTMSMHALEKLADETIRLLKEETGVKDG